MDLVIRNGRIVDGTGRSAYIADIGIAGGTIVSVGRVLQRGKTEIDAEGLVVTPGFIDAHTHMDAQVHWDPLGSCSSWHGVTSVVMGNCGFSLAPSRANARQLITRNLERAEDISAAAMAAGIQWKWETFPEYLDALDRLPMGINYATYIGHSALRTWVMGEDAFEREATEEELKIMERAVAEALRAGAIGLSTSLSPNHETADDRPVASRQASWDEVRRLVLVMREVGIGIFELSKEAAANSPDLVARKECLERMCALAVDSKVPMTFGLTALRGWQDHLGLLDETFRLGGRMYGQANSRSVNVLMSFRTRLPFDSLPEWRTVRGESLEVQRRLLQDPQIKRQLIDAAHHGAYARAVGAEARKPNWDELRVYTGPFPPYPLVRDIAAERAVDVVELMIDLALETNFDQFFIQSAVGGQEQHEPDVMTILRHPHTVMTFSDSGAHVTQIADFSIQTHMLAYWVRERGAFTLEEAVRMITSEPAKVWELHDRGRILEGMAADLNLIDLERLMPGKLEVSADLPTGAKRLVQKATGYAATIVAGQVVLRDGVATGALPGRLLRSKARCV